MEHCIAPPAVAAAPPALTALDELAQLDQWVVTKLVHGFDKAGNPKTDKPPMRRTGRRLVKCSHSDPTDWTSYDAAQALVDAGFDGAEAVGFVFADCDPYTGVDFDGCRDPQTGEIASWAAPWIAKLSSYTEISKSETGVKVWVRGTLPKELKLRLGEHKGIEVYSRKRFFWMTGNRLEGTPATINDAQAVLDEMALTFDPPKPKPDPKPAPTRRISLGEHAAERLSLADARERFNDQHSLESLLAEYGAEEIRPGYWSCPFCTHTHDITLYISQQGRLFSLSPHCKLHTRHGWDPFSLECLVSYKDNVTSFLKTINPPAPRTHQKRQEPPTVDAPEYLTVDAAERRRKDRERKKQACITLAAERRAHAEQRAAQDGDLSYRAQLVLAALLDLAGARDWTRASVTAIAELIGQGRRFVSYGLKDLENAGYIRSLGTKGGAAQCTATRQFVARSEPSADDPTCARETLHDVPVHTNIYIACSEGEPGERVSGAREPAGDDPDAWEWSDPAVGTADLEPPAAPATLPRSSEGWKEQWRRTDAYQRDLDQRWRIRDDVPDAGDVAEQQQLTAVATVAQPAVCFGPPPNGTRAGKRYWRLLGKADRVEREGHAKQAYALRQQAKALEEPIAVVDELPPAREDRVIDPDGWLDRTETDTALTPLAGVPIETAEEWAAVMADCAPRPLTSSRRFAPAGFDYPPDYVTTTLLPNIRALKAARLATGGVM